MVFGKGIISRAVELLLMQHSLANAAGQASGQTKPPAAPPAPPVSKQLTPCRAPAVHPIHIHSASAE